MAGAATQLGLPPSRDYLVDPVEHMVGSVAASSHLHLAQRGPRLAPKVRQDGPMRGPKLMALAVVAFFAGALLAVHLLTEPRSPAPATSIASAPPEASFAPRPAVAFAPVSVPAPTVVASPRPLTPPAAPEPPHGVVEEGLPPSLDLGVAPLPPAPVFAARVRKVNDCVERRLREGGGNAGSALPGRLAPRPTRGEERLRRLQLRAACERELAG